MEQIFIVCLITLVLSAISAITAISCWVYNINKSKKSVKLAEIKAKIERFKQLKSQTADVVSQMMIEDKINDLENQTKSE